MTHWCHCEERGDEAISLRTGRAPRGRHAVVSTPRDDPFGVIARNAVTKQSRCERDVRHEIATASLPTPRDDTLYLSGERSLISFSLRSRPHDRPRVVQPVERPSELDEIPCIALGVRSR